MKAEHTKGPWVGIEDGKYRETPWILDHEDDHGATWVPITNSAGRTIALVVNDDTQRPLKVHERETEANARLIAAAPELLEALEDLARLAEAAMLEANRDWYDIDLELADARAAIRKARGGV